LDTAKQRAQQLGRALGSPLENLLHPCEALLDPLDRRSLEHPLAAAAQPVQLLAQCFDPALRLDQRLGEHLASSPLADEVDEVREAVIWSSMLSGRWFSELYRA
jgi:hypothetical protein